MLFNIPFLPILKKKVQEEALKSVKVFEGEKKSLGLGVFVEAAFEHCVSRTKMDFLTL